MSWNLIIYIVFCQGENQNSLIMDIDDQNTTYVFTSKGHPDYVFELESPATSKCLNIVN